LRAINTLEIINGKPKAEAFKARESLDLWCKEIAALKPVQQDKAIGDELQKRNPDFDPVLSSQIFNGALTNLQFQSDKVTDISPLRAAPNLKGLDCAGSGPGKGLLADLWPLTGLPLHYLNIDNTKVADLSPLQGMPLEFLRMRGTPVIDLTPLRGLPLKEIYLDFRAPRDLDVLRSLTALRKINDVPADEYLKKVSVIAPKVKQGGAN